MDREELSQLNEAIASLHEPDDVFSYEIDRSRRIKFPRGFLRTFDTNRRLFDFIEDENLKNKIIMHLMHRDTLHWLWLKTDITAHARQMMIKFQLINLASVLEGIAKHLTHGIIRSGAPIYDHIDYLQGEGKITNGVALKQLWSARNSIHLHLTGEVENVEFSDENYVLWHSALEKMLRDLN